MATLSDLRTKIANKLSNGQLVRPTASQIDEAINSTIDFYERSYFWFQESLFTITLTSGNNIITSADLPSDFKFQQHPNSLVIVKDGIPYPLEQITPIKFDSINTSNSLGLPISYTYRNKQFELYPTPNQDYSLNLYYFRSYADLVNDGDSNDFTAHAPRLIEYHTMKDLIVDYKDDDKRYINYERITKQEYDNILEETNYRSATGRLSTENIAKYDRTNSHHHFYYFNY